MVCTYFGLAAERFGGANTMRLSFLLRKGVAVVMSGLFLLVGLTMISPSQADAAAPEFGIDLVLAPGAACPAGTTDIGVWQLAQRQVCRPIGFAPVSSQALCSQGAAALGSLNIAWLDQGTRHGCLWTAVAQLGGPACSAPASLHRGVSPFGQLADWCGLPVLVKGGVDTTLPTPICIEDVAADMSETAQSLSVGSIYTDSSGSTFVISTGTSSCSFNCHAGFDMNCDDILGDYCPAEFDRRTVAGAAKCLAAAAAE